MSEVTVDIAGRNYRLGCGEGEEEHLTSLAAMIDTDARHLVKQFGQMSEGRLLLMTSLLIADRLAEAEEKAHQAEQRLKQVEAKVGSQAKGDAFGPEREQELTDRINELVDQLENLGDQPKAAEA